MVVTLTVARSNADFRTGVVCRHVQVCVSTCFCRTGVVARPPSLEPRGWALDNTGAPGACRETFLQMTACFPIQKAAWDPAQVNDTPIWRSLRCVISTTTRWAHVVPAQQWVAAGASRDAYEAKLRASLVELLRSVCAAIPG